jgi:hypothetical protein
MSIGDNLPQEMKDHLEKATNNIKRFNEQIQKEHPEGYTNILSVLKRVETQLENFKSGLDVDDESS